MNIFRFLVMIQQSGFTSGYKRCSVRRLTVHSILATPLEDLLHREILRFSLERDRGWCRGRVAFLGYRDEGDTGRRSGSKESPTPRPQSRPTRRLLPPGPVAHRDP